MNGVYLGKDLSSLSTIFDILKVCEEEKQLILELVVLIDSARSRQISSSKPKNKTPTT